MLPPIFSPASSSFHSSFQLIADIRLIFMITSFHIIDMQLLSPSFPSSRHLFIVATINAQTGSALCPSMLDASAYSSF